MNDPISLNHPTGTYPLRRHTVCTEFASNRFILAENDKPQIFAVISRLCSTVVIFGSKLHP